MIFTEIAPTLLYAACIIILPRLGILACFNFSRECSAVQCLIPLPLYFIIAVFLILNVVESLRNVYLAREVNLDD